MPLNSEQYQIDFDFLTQNRVNVAYLTPSHLYPFGHVLPINQRLQLLEWATEQDDRYIIEDDYDSEFRYKGKPILRLGKYSASQEAVEYSSQGIRSKSKFLEP